MNMPAIGSHWRSRVIDTSITVMGYHPRDSERVVYCYNDDDVGAHTKSLSDFHKAFKRDTKVVQHWIVYDRIMRQVLAGGRSFETEEAALRYFSYEGNENSNLSVKPIEVELEL